MDTAMRDGYIKFEGDKTSLAINKIYGTCLNMVLNPHFDETRRLDR